jgi:hypothetical protein
MEQDKWLYHNTLKWKEETKADLKFLESKQQIEVATPPEFGGHENIISPEDTLRILCKRLLHDNAAWHTEEHGS